MAHRTTYAELLHDLPRLERADLDAEALGQLAARLADADEVAASGLTPHDLWIAYRHSGAVLFAPELATALQHSLASVPALPGRTLVLVDTSGSMAAPVDGNDGVRAFEIGAVFAAAVADAARRAGGSADLVLYGHEAEPHAIAPTVVRTVDDVAAHIGELGHVAELWANASTWYDGHDRVMVFTDVAEDPAGAPEDVRHWPCPIYVFDLRGRGRDHNDHHGRRHVFAGFSGRAYRRLAALDAAA
jgi:hypothetical protein